MAYQEDGSMHLFRTTSRSRRYLRALTMRSVGVEELGMGNYHSKSARSSQYTILPNAFGQAESSSSPVFSQNPNTPWRSPPSSARIYLDHEHQPQHLRDYDPRRYWMPPEGPPVRRSQRLLQREALRYEESGGSGATSPVPVELWHLGSWIKRRKIQDLCGFFLEAPGCIEMRDGCGGSDGEREEHEEVEMVEMVEIEWNGKGKGKGKAVMVC
ncbi:hypothetical protein F5884DRAFT_793514 [Xylogone sp. PMI_703]|nr:hypothetical protein F5884DRAFT_793514 [Xylogone sp. PMI_703]